MKSLISGAVAAALLAGAAAASAQQDRIVKADGVEIKCRITRATWQTVMYTPAPGKSETLKGTDVAEIYFGDEPEALKSAKNAYMNEKKPEKAATRFEEALKEIETKKLRAENKAPLFLHWGLFLAERGDIPASLAMLKRIRTECGDSWWRPDSYRKSLEVARSKPEEYKAVLEEMKAEPEPMASEAKMSLAELATAKSEHDEALRILNEVAGNTSSPYAEVAKLGIFRILKTQKKNADLDAYCQKIQNDAAASPSLQQAAGAWVAGALLEKAGKDKTKIRNALFAAAKAIAMGPPERKEEAEDYVAALRVAAKGYAAMAEDLTKPEQKQEYKTRASGYLMEIVRAYKGTPWADAAQLELQALGVKDN